MLARAGVRVTLAERQAFPRDKVCGDLIGTDAVAALHELGLAGVLTGSIALDGARVYAPDGRGAGRLHGAGRGTGSARVLERATFDDRLLAHAVAAGAEVARARVLGLARDEHGDVRGVRTAAGDIGARVVIGADGFGSAIARSSHPRTDGAQSRSDVALVTRAYASGVRDLDAAMHFFVNRKADGYGWVFPLGDGRANVGLGYIASEGRHDLRAGFERFLRDGSPAGALLAGAQLGAPKTWPIPLGLHGRIAEAGVFLAGDAAALASPLSGSGIASAVRSGERAAREAQRFLQGDVAAAQRYTRTIRAKIGVRLQAEGLVHRVAGTPAAIGPWLAIVRNVHAESALSRALLALG